MFCRYALIIDIIAIIDIISFRFSEQFLCFSARASGWPLEAGHHRCQAIRLLLLLRQRGLLQTKRHRRRHESTLASTHILPISCDNQVGIPCSGRRYQSWDSDDTSKTVSVADIGIFWVSCVQRSFWERITVFLRLNLTTFQDVLHSASDILLRDCTIGMSGPQCGDSQCHALNMPNVFKRAKWNLMKPEWNWMNQI